MALLPSIMSLFGNRTPPASAPVTTGNPASPVVQQQQGAQAATNPTVPSASTPQSTGTLSAIPPAGQGEQSPMDQYKELWKTDPAPKEGAPAAPSLVPSLNLDHSAIMASAKKVNFLAGVDKAIMDRVTAGDMGAVMEAMNQVGQFAFASGLSGSGELVKNSLTNAQGVLKDSILPGAFRQQAITQALTASNPVFSNPAVAPMMGMLQSKLMEKYPTATPDQIAATATDYLAQMSGQIVQAAGGQIVTKQQQAQQNGGYGQKPQEDWETFFSLAQQQG